MPRTHVLGYYLPSLRDSNSPGAWRRPFLLTLASRNSVSYNQIRQPVFHEMSAMAKLGHGNGSGKFHIQVDDLGGWLRVHTDLKGTIPDDLAGQE